MRRLLFLMLLFLAVAPAMAETSFQSKEKFSQWLTFYYEKPEPNRIPDAVDFMSKSGILDNDKASSPIFGFLSGIFRNNPDKVDSWINQFSSFKEQHLKVIVLGLWYADLPESRKTVYALLDKHPNLKDSLSYLYEGAPITVEQIPLAQGAWVLDALWGNFMATGDKTPVERIITALPWIDVKGNINQLIVGGAARWSLQSNAVQHKRVLDICEEVAKSSDSDVAVKLDEIIKNAKNETKEKENAAVSGGWFSKDGKSVPNTDAMKSTNGFGGWLVVTPDSDWEAKWNTSPEAIPNFTEAKDVSYGEKLTILAFYINPKVNASGDLDVLCDIKVTRPDGSSSVNTKGVQCGDGKLGGDPRNIRLSYAVINYVGEAGDPPGEWIVDVTLTDKTRGTAIPLKTHFNLRKKVK